MSLNYAQSIINLRAITAMPLIEALRSSIRSGPHDARLSFREPNIFPPSKRNSKGIKISSVNMAVLRITQHVRQVIEGNMGGLPIAGICHQ